MDPRDSGRDDRRTANRWAVAAGGAHRRELNAVARKARPFPTKTTRMGRFPDHRARIELWGGVEPTLNRVGDRYHSQLERTGLLGEAVKVPLQAAERSTSGGQVGAKTKGSAGQ